MAPNFNEATKASELVPFYATKIIGKTILVTGISTGSLGESFVKQVALEIKVKSLTLDLMSLAQVRKAAELVNSWADIPHIDVLVKGGALSPE
ncbi:hypothetical protein FOVSG1_015429 [Fusarium oxysporum f. sp. vasinfectum]